MAESNIKGHVKRHVKRGLIIVKKGLAKSPQVRRVAKMVRNVLFTDPGQNTYNTQRYAPSIAEYQKQVKGWESFKHQPTISLVMPTYNTPIEYLKRCIDSVILQSYPKWELCIADDNSPDKEVVKTIEDYIKQEPRIKLVKRKENGHISAATNSAIEVATGDFIALLDHDDIIWPNALYEIAKVINEKPDTDFVYSDEDKIDDDDDNHTYPFFKPDWSPEFLESCNYITHFACIRADKLRQVGGIRVGYEGAQDWDLFLRVAGITDKIVHIPKVIYSWRIHEASTAHSTDAKPYVYVAQRKLLEDHVLSTKLKATVSQGIIKQHSSVSYAVIGEPLVSVVVYARGSEETKRCVQSVLNRSGYANCEIIIVSDAASSAGAVRFAADLAAGNEHVRHLTSAKDLKTTSARYNLGFKATKGDYVAWIQPYMHVTTDGWVGLMLGDAQRDGVGVVGAKLVNSLRTEYISAGVALGIDGFCGDLLNGVALTDIHYMRGLYGQSRRNTLAARGLLMVRRSVFEKAGWLSEAMTDERLADIDACLRMFQEGGVRHVYTPYVEAIDTVRHTGNIDYRIDPQQKELFMDEWGQYAEYDPYLNPNFSRVGAHLNVK